MRAATLFPSQQGLWQRRLRSQLAQALRSRSSPDLGRILSDLSGRTLGGPGSPERFRRIGGRAAVRFPRQFRLQTSRGTFTLFGTEVVSTNGGFAWATQPPPEGFEGEAINPAFNQFVESGTETFADPSLVPTP